MGPAAAGVGGRETEVVECCCVSEGWFAVQVWSIDVNFALVLVDLLVTCACVFQCCFKHKLSVLLQAHAIIELRASLAQTCCPCRQRWCQSCQQSTTPEAQKPRHGHQTGCHCLKQTSGWAWWQVLMMAAALQLRQPQTSPAITVQTTNKSVKTHCGEKLPASSLVKQPNLTDQHTCCCVITQWLSVPAGSPGSESFKLLQPEEPS